MFIGGKLVKDAAAIFCKAALQNENKKNWLSAKKRKGDKRELAYNLFYLLFPFIS
jgi:hypothetical protein